MFLNKIFQTEAHWKTTCNCMCHQQQTHDDLQQHMQEKNKHMKENKDKPISSAQAERSQRLQKLCTVDGNASCDVCKQDFPDRGSLEIHMQSHLP